MSARTALLVAAMAALMLFSACRNQPTEATDTGTQIMMTVTPEKPKVGPATLAVRVQDPAGKPVSGAKVSVVGDMSHAGMQPVNRDAKDNGDGSYTVDTFAFSMKGDWFITVKAVTPDGKTTQKRFDLKGVTE